MLLTLSVSSSDFISYFLPITTYFHCVLEAILVTIYIFLRQINPKQGWMQKRLHKRGRKGKNLNVIIQGLVF